MTADPLAAHFGKLEEFIFQRALHTDAKLDRVLAGLAGIKPRLSAVEVQLGNLTAGIGRVNERIDRIERRAELIGEPTA